MPLRRDENQYFHFSLPSHETNAATIATQLETLRSMIGAQSVKEVESAATGSYCVVKLAEPDTTWNGARNDDWTNDWYQPRHDHSFVVLHEPTQAYHAVRTATINGEPKSNVRVYPLGKASITALSEQKSLRSQTAKRLVYPFEAKTFLLKSGNTDMLAFSRQDADPVDFGSARWHRVTPSETSALGDRVMDKYDSHPDV